LSYWRCQDASGVVLLGRVGVCLFLLRDLLSLCSSVAVVTSFFLVLFCVLDLYWYNGSRRFSSLLKLLGILETLRFAVLLCVFSPPSGNLVFFYSSPSLFPRHRTRDPTAFFPFWTLLFFHGLPLSPSLCLDTFNIYGSTPGTLLWGFLGSDLSHFFAFGDCGCRFFDSRLSRLCTSFALVQAGRAFG